MKKLLGGIDAGGTKFLCAVGREPDDIVDMEAIPTTSKAETLARAISFFQRHEARLEGIGISCFGPLDLNPDSTTFGSIASTTKPGWNHFNVKTHLSNHLPGIPVRIDTDVNGAALAEQKWGAAQDTTHLAYVTVGTGIGVGIISGDKLVTGLGHPELGHYKVPRHCDDPPYSFAGMCPYHHDCLEGLASGPALRDRFRGLSPELISDESPVWSVIADYLAHLCTVLIFTFSPQRIVFGGGVMNRKGLLERIQRATSAKLGEYLHHEAYSGSLDVVIRRSDFLLPLAGRRLVNAGVLGGFILASRAAAERDGLASKL